MLYPRNPSAHYNGIDLLTDGLLNVTDAAKLISVHRTTLYNAMERGELPYFKVGRARRIPRAALRIWVEVF